MHVILRQQVQDEYEELLKLMQADDQAIPVTSANAEIMQKAKGVLFFFSVAQDTARKLADPESQLHLAKAVLDNAKKSDYWTEFSQELQDDLDHFLKEEKEKAAPGAKESEPTN